MMKLRGKAWKRSLKTHIKDFFDNTLDLKDQNMML